MSTYPYQEILNQFQQLPDDAQFQLIEDMLEIVRKRNKTKKLHNIMEFRGMDKESWAGIDVEKYIDEERNSWNG